MELSHYLYASLAIFCGGLIQGTTGFGFALVTVPILLVFMPIQQAVVLLGLIAACNALLVAHSARRHVRIGLIWPMLAGGLAAVPFGAYLLVVLDARTLQIAVGVLVCIFAALFLFGCQWKTRHERLGLAASGVLSGLIGGCIAMSGPPVVIFLANQGVAKHVSRANLASYFFCMNVAAQSSYAIGGIHDTSYFLMAAGFLPALVVGTTLGVRLSRRLNERLFRRVTLAVLLIMGALALGKGLASKPLPDSRPAPAGVEAGEGT